MNTIHAESSLIINARPEILYAVVADYETGHRAILPKPYFEEMKIEKGGVGTGTIIRLKMKVFGQESHYHQLVTEPEPGRVIVETDMETGQFSSFTFDPLNGGTQTRVTIASYLPASPGIKGFFERLFTPTIMRHIFKKELQNLANYVGSDNLSESKISER